MLDLTSAKAGRLRSATETDIEQRKAIAGLGDDDIPRITSLQSMIEQRADHCAEVFFNQLVKIDAPELFARRGVLDQAKQRKRDRSRRRNSSSTRARGGGRPRAEHRPGDREGSSRHDRSRHGRRRHDLPFRPSDRPAAVAGHARKSLECGGRPPGFPPGALKQRQPAYKPGSGWHAGKPACATAIPLGRRLPGASSNLPGRADLDIDPAAFALSRKAARRPYSVLLPVGFAVPPALPPARCALTAPFHPCRGIRNARGGLFSVALSLGSRPPDVIRHRLSTEPGLSSPAAFRLRRSGRPAD